MRRPKSRPSSSARSCSRPTKPSMRRLSSSSWLSRPVAVTDRMASAVTIAMITTTTNISTSVKPLLRMLRHLRAPRLFLIDGRGADVGIGSIAAGLAVAAVARDVVIPPIGAGGRIDVRITPRILGHRPQVAADRIILDGGIGRLLDQCLKSLFGGWIFEIIQAVRIQRPRDGPYVGFCGSQARLIDL